MKVAINHYGRFELPKLELYLNKLDSFIVTPKIEDTKQFQTGVQRGKFEIIEVTDLSVVERAVNVTPQILENFRDALTEDPEPEPPTDHCGFCDFTGTKEEVDAHTESEHPEPDQSADEQTPADEGEKADEGAGEGEDSLDDTPFTELAKNKAEALKMIEKETDIEKLNSALKDDRKYVKEAVTKRLKALEG